jgi:CheY-like chemotaxis protein
LANVSTTRLLVVDDDAFVRGALTRALDRTGAFSVLPAENGQHALDLLEREPVNAILTDLQMPVMDGLTMIGHLFERGIRVPLAVMTGQAIAPDLARRLHDYGVAASFTKPVDIGPLADELQRALDPEAVGRIRGITLFGFLQLLGVERKTAVVVVHGNGLEGRCYFDDGRLVHAHTRRIEGLEAVYEILAWVDPTVEIFYKRRPHGQTVREPLHQVLMEAARLLDERGRGGGGGGGPSAQAEPATRAEPGRDEGGGGVEAVLEDALEIAGVVGVALVHAPSGRVVGAAGGRVSFDVELAATAAAELVRAQQRWLGALDLDDAIDDVILTLGKQYHLVRPLGVGRDDFLYLVLSRQRANLGQARQQLAKLARRLES